MALRRLYPDPGPTSPEEATTGLRLGDQAPPERPYLVLNMVASLDGRISIGGRSGGLANEHDRAIFHGLRTQADAVMAGAGTVRAERYGRIVRSRDRQEIRAREGLAREPLAVVVSASLDLSPDIPLLDSSDSRVVVMTPSAGELPPVRASIDYLRGEPSRAADDRVALVMRPLLERLRAEYGIRSIVCEGGPRLNDGLLREGLVDELFLSLAPKVVAGTEPMLVVGAGFTPPLELSLVSARESDDYLYLRYRVQR